jgi:FkbM family methyltransferase
MRIIDSIANKFPFLGPYKRILKAMWDSVMPVKTYSQHGEDAFIWELLSKRDFVKGIYVDVGANHPTSISNTYLFYRKGFSGICIEPNSELARLHRWFRRRDKVFEVGIDNKRGISELNISKTPVLSSFKKMDGQSLWKKQHVPVLRLDDVINSVNPGRIFLLSIDTEGLNYQVIQGANDTLTNTELVCVEFDNDQEEALLTKYLSTKHKFRKLRTMGCNVIFANEYYDER